MMSDAWGTAAKKRKGEEGGNQGARGSSDKHRLLIEKTAHLAKQLQAEMRTQKAITCVTILVPSDTALVKNMLQANVDYRNKTEGRPGHGLGGPELHRWRAAVLTILEDKDAAAEIQAMMKTHADTATPETMKRLVGHCVIKETFKKEGNAARHRIELGGRPQMHDVFDALGIYVENTLKGTVCHGRGPRTHSERKLSELMGSMNLWSKGNRSASSKDEEEMAVLGD